MKYRELFDSESTVYCSLSDLSAFISNEKSYVYIKNGKVYFNQDELFPVGIIKLKGEHNLINALLSVGATYRYVKKSSIIKALSTFGGVSDRCELVGTKNGIYFINSSVDSTPTRTINTLSVFHKDKIIVLLGGYDKNLSYDILNEALNGVKAIILMGENREKIYKMQNIR
jgi:UDP-N-acetylmuramoylalanine--D-glutamate ligase